MTLEGAQGQTALEMGRVLHVPAELRQDGVRPWKLDAYHAGFAALQRSLQPNTAGERATRTRLAGLRQELQTVNNQLQRAGYNYDARTQALGQRAEQLAATINQMQEQVDQYELEIANAVWVDQAQPVERDFATQLARFYGTGSLQAADFQHRFPAERQRINRWVEAKTRDRIKDLIPNVDGRLLRMILVNAVYFKGQWSTPFQADATRPEPFYLADGSKAQRPSMYRRFTVGYAAFQGDGSYFETPDMVNQGGNEPRVSRRRRLPGGRAAVQGGQIGHGRDRAAQSTGIARPAGEAERRNLEKWLGKLQRREAYVTLPKFKVDSTLPSMQATLSKLGMNEAFAPFAANFHGIARSSRPEFNLYISQVLHKAFIEVNEKGSEAAAATAVMGPMAGAAPPAFRLVPFIPEFRADRPFLFLIRDFDSGAVLFMGRVTLPAA